MTSSLCLNQVRRISQKAMEKLRVISSQNLVWKANEHDPRKHTSEHEGLFYPLPEDPKQVMQIFAENRIFDPIKHKYHDSLGTTQLMIRKPFLTAIDYIEKLNSNNSSSVENPPLPNVRVLFYGDEGTGKTMTLNHLIHYLHLKQEHIIVHIRQIKRFTRSPYGTQESTTRPGRIDTPISASLFLQHFRTQNASLLESLKDTLTCSQDYKWSLREITKAGEPVSKVVDHGVNRIIHASDCVAVLFKELMLAADQGKIKLVSLIDNVRFLYTFEAGVLKHEDYKQIYIDEITVARAIKKLIKGTYRSGLVLATCDNKFSRKQNQTPREVLGLEGWQDFDPCLPINVPPFSRKEFENCMNFYQDIGWLCRPESRTVEARDEIRFISGMNPFEVAKLCQAI